MTEEVKEESTETQDPTLTTPPARQTFWKQKPQERSPPKGERATDLKLVDLRVGRIKQVKKESSTKNYIALIDIKKPSYKIAPILLMKPYQRYDIEGLKKKQVVVACNLPVVTVGNVETNVRIMGGVKHNLAEVLELPENTKTGRRVYAEGYMQESYWMIKELKFNQIAKELRINATKEAMYTDLPLKVEGEDGPIKVKTLKNCAIKCL